MERTIETQVITKLFTLLDGTGKFKKVFRGESIQGKGIPTVLEWSRVRGPWALAVPDLIVASDNFDKAPDDVFLLAIEAKYFPRDAASSKSHWRQSFREIGQPLRDLLFGFDAAVLWHLFSETVPDGDAREYSAMCGELIEKLKLPIIYFATALTEQSQFGFFHPWRMEKTFDANYVAGCIQQINNERNGSYRPKMNPLLQDQQVLGLRKALKATLKIP